MPKHSFAIPDRDFPMSVYAMSGSATSRFAPQNANLAQLCDALAAGWRIEPPIYLRYQWFGRDGRGYYFIVKRGLHVDLRVVTDGEAIRAWVRAHRLSVVEC